MYYGQLELDKFINDKFFNNKINGFFIECGACNGLLESTCKFFEESLFWKGINIEPSSFLFSKLIENRPNSINENSALGGYNGKIEFSHVIHPILGKTFGNGSIKHTKDHYDSLIKDGCKIEKEIVNIMKYSTLINKYNIKNIDLFVLDVEGYEIEVLSSLSETSIHPYIFCIEDNKIDKKILNIVMDINNYKYIENYYDNSFYKKILN